MAASILLQGKDYPWLVDDQGNAYVFVKGDSSKDVVTNYDPATSTTEYVGKAAAGVATSAAGWQVKRLTIAANGGITTETADGNLLFDNVWDNRTGLIYN